MAGVILVVMGFAKLGAMIKFIPHPVITGFTSGIAVIIFSGGIKDLLGLHMGEVPPGFFEKWITYAQTASGFTPAAVGVSALSLAVIVLWPKVTRRVPGTFIALIITTAVVSIMNLPVETIGSRFGATSASVPPIQLRSVSFAQISALVGPAFTIADLAAIESLLSAALVDGLF